MRPLATPTLLLLAALLGAPAGSARAAGLPFVEGDYAQALADARARHVPLVVDVWAPW